MKITIFAVAALLGVTCVNVWANGDEAGHKQRAAQTDMSLFRDLDRAGNGFLVREDTRGDLNLGTRFDDIDTNRDGIVTLREMQVYIEKMYGVIPAPGGNANKT
ncbi:MAG TPA: hypothetical protein VFO57_02065 [Burkholderiales bacterium]|nr:hypothetical protein [Burkholderiales bacterium]